MPGTTLGLINVPGLPLGPKHRAFDTPGVPHAYQLTSLLSPAEVKQVGGWLATWFPLACELAGGWLRSVYESGRLQGSCLEPCCAILPDHVGSHGTRTL